MADTTRPEDDQGRTPFDDDQAHTGEGDPPREPLAPQDDVYEPGADAAFSPAEPHDADEAYDDTLDDEPYDADEDYADTHGELELGDDDGRLPWLEGDEDEDLGGGHNTGQLVMVAVLGILLLALVVGGLWWATRDGPDDTVVAQGETIEAPAEPYKERPEDPGGKTFDGTGDTSFAVSEGQTRPVRLGDENAKAPAAEEPAAAPGFASVDTPEKATQASEPAATSGGVGVQVGAYSTREAAEKGWSTLSGRSEALSGLSHRVVEGKADIGTVYRLQAVASDAKAARALCSTLKSGGINCNVKN